MMTRTNVRPLAARPLCTGMLLALVLSLAATAVFASPTAAQKCSAAKVKAAGAAVYANSKCEQKAIADATTVDGGCVGIAEGKLSDAFTTADGKGGCTVTGNAADVQSDVDACLADYVAAITGEAKCAAAKMKAVGKKTDAKGKCWQKGLLSGSNADAACLSSAEAKFDTAIANADGLGTCTDTAPILEALVDDCITNVIEDDTTAPPVTCTLADNTTPTGTVAPDGCALLDRDVSACESSRTTAGLSGYWLKFSCRVTLSKSATTVTAQSDGQPDYASNYFATANVCHETYTGAIQNPNLIAAQVYSVTFPLTPNTTSQTMNGTAVVGLSLNGVPVFGNFAAPGDNIFDEAATFDRCGAHPQMSGKYHYHSEPYSITYDDANFVGVMRDGYPIYGRRDPNLSLPTLDAQGGHTGVTVDSPVTPVYHYHVNEQINPTNASDSQWFLTTGTFHGTPSATCTNCN